MADPAVYRPFLEARPPRDVHPALLLGAFRNFQAKLLAAWSRADAASRPPHDLIDLVEAYGDAYPAERAEATRIFLVTTYGATALAERRSRRRDARAGRVAAGDADGGRAVRAAGAAGRRQAQSAVAARWRRPSAATWVRRKQPRVWSLTRPDACMNA